jgi:hypothetical protein
MGEDPTREKRLAEEDFCRTKVYDSLQVQTSPHPISSHFPYPLVNPVSSPLENSGPLNPHAWSYWLSHHPDRPYAHTLVDIIKHGAKIGYTGPLQQTISKNLASAADAPAVLSADLYAQLAQCQLGRTAVLPDHFISSPLGLVPKSDGSFRRIHHLSHPAGRSVNDHIPQHWGTLTYTKFDDAIRAVAHAGRNSTLVKRDLADAFRHIPVSHEDWWLLGFHWDGMWWYDKFLPFGLRTSPYIFDLFATGLHWILENEFGWSSILHYLEDFLAIIPPTQNADLYAHDFARLCEDLGFRIKEKKSTMGTTANFLGLEIDTQAMEARLPSEKHAKALLLVRIYLKRKFITLLELQSVIGFLSFAAKVVPLGRPFLRRLYNALSCYRGGSPAQPRRITAAMRADLRWWLAFLPQWDGITLIRPSRRTFWVWTDAAGTKGLGGYYLEDHASPLQDLSPTQAFSARVPRHHRRKHINTKELLAVRKAIDLWAAPGPLSGCRLILHIDNTAVVGGLTKRSIKGEAMNTLRSLLVTAAAHDLELVPRWIPSSENSLADALSRREWRKIADLCPQLTRHALTSSIHPKAGMQMSKISNGALPATYGGASLDQPAPPTLPHAAATPTTAR